MRIARHPARPAGGHQPTYAGMTYYDPLLATWLLGESGQATARLSVWLTNLLNGVEAASYVLNGFRVAPVSSAFKTNDFSMTATLPGLEPCRSTSSWSAR